MNKVLLLILLFVNVTVLCQDSMGKHLAKQGQVTFFSYTVAENIEAINNQVLGVIDAQTNEIAVDILMRAFVFKKTLMREHFNESYIESDLYPKATFRGKIVDFDPTQLDAQTRMIQGDFTLKDRTVPLTFKVKIEPINGSYSINGTTEVLVENYNINIPKFLSPNIAKNIKVSFNFKFTAYEK